MKTILVVEDDETILATIKLALAQTGKRVLTATNGGAGLELARRYLPDLILSDINMPGGDGRTLLHEIRGDAAVASTQVVLMTGNKSSITPRAGMNLGADDFLVKPFSVSDLAICVEARLRRADISWRVEDRFLADLRSTLSSTLPHEVFTPLAGILGLSDVLQTDLERFTKDEIREVLGDISECGERLNRTLRNYLLLLELRFQRVSVPDGATSWDALSSSIEKAAQRALTRHGRTHDAVMALTKQSLVIDAHHLETIVEELVDNACRYSRAGRPVQLSLAENGVLRVSDEGRGMTPDQLRELGILRQFDQEHSEQHGLGLGLELVRRLASLNSAAFEITSESGVGTTVTVGFRTHSADKQADVPASFYQTGASLPPATSYAHNLERTCEFRGPLPPGS